MPKAKKSIVVKSESSNKAYLTKRRLVSAARAAFRSAAADALRVMGYTVVAQNGWVVKKYSDGSFEKIKKLVSQKKNIKFILD